MRRGHCAMRLPCRLTYLNHAMQQLHDRQFGHTQRQPFHAVAHEIDLRPGVVAAAFKHHDLAFAKLVVKHAHAAFQAVCGRVALRRHRWIGKPFAARIF